MMWLSFTILVALWIVGVIAGVGGNAIHALLAAALGLLVYQFATSRRATP